MAAAKEAVDEFLRPARLRRQGTGNWQHSERPAEHHRLGRTSLAHRHSIFSALSAPVPPPPRAARVPKGVRSKLLAHLKDLQELVLSAVDEQDDDSIMSPISSLNHGINFNVDSPTASAAPSRLPSGNAGHSIDGPLGEMVAKDGVYSTTGRNSSSDDMLKDVQDHASGARSTTMGNGGGDAQSRRNKRVARIREVIQSEPDVERDRPSWRASARRFVTHVEYVAVVLIFINCITLGVSLDINPEWLGWAVIDTIFALVFSAELILKIVVERKGFFLSSNKFWNMFESSLVLMGLAEVVLMLTDNTAGSQGIRMMRVLRVARVVRLLRLCRIPFFNELWVMVQSAVGGTRTLSWATVLMCMPLYFATLFYRTTLGSMAEQGHGAENFESVPTAFFTLFRCILSAQCVDNRGSPIFVKVASFYGWGYTAFYCLFEFCMCVGLFNVVVGLFLERVLANARYNVKVQERDRLLDESFFATKITELAGALYETAKSLAGETDVLVPPVNELLQECQQMEFTEEILFMTISKPKVMNILNQLQVATEDTWRLFHVCDSNGDGNMDLAEFFDGIANLRGSPCRSDMVRLTSLVEQVLDLIKGEQTPLQLELSVATGEKPSFAI